MALRRVGCIRRLVGFASDWICAMRWHVVYPDAAAYDPNSGGDKLALA